MPMNFPGISAIEIADAIPGGFFIYHADGNEELIYANEELLRLFQCRNFEELCEHTHHSFRGMVHPDDLEEVEKSIKEQIKENKQKLDYVEYRIITRSGDIRLVEDFGHLIHNKELGNLFYVFVSDITETKKQLKAANEAKSRFLAGMSHDIRTPMNAIIGYATLAQSKKNSMEKLKEYNMKILSASNHLLALFNDVLDMQRIENGKLKLDVSAYCLSDILAEIRTILQTEVKEKRLHFSIDTQNVQNECVYCDKGRLIQVILNLLTNAIKFTPAGGKISLTIRQEMGQEGNWSKYIFIVKDTGIGIAPEFMDRVFVPFEREDREWAISSIGTGLGLSIAKSVVELMDGTIKLESLQNEGTTITVAIPFRIAEQFPFLFEISKVRGKRALVIDDDFHTCDSVTNMLLQMGVRADWTMSGMEAILRTKQAAKRNDKYDFFILDWELPDMNGIDVARKMREEIGWDSPILLLSAYDWTAVEEEAVLAGVTGFCSKPLFLSNLQDSLMKVFGFKEQFEQELFRTEEVLKKKRILLVEDNEVNQEIAKELLEEADFVVDIAENGKIALDILEKQSCRQFDAILMDIQMPVLDGYETTKRIRASKKSFIYNIPIIAMTANAFEEDRRQAFEAGMNDFLTKPIDLRELLKKLEKVIT